MSKELVCKAIGLRRIIAFHYKGASRRVEPFTLGYDRKSTLTLRGWQLSGGSGQDWRAYHLALVTGIEILNDEFDGNRPDYNPNDSTMSAIICRI